MFYDDIGPIHGVSADTRLHEAQKAHAKEQLVARVGRQVESAEDFQGLMDQALFTPTRMQKNFEKLADRMKQTAKEKKSEKSEKKAPLNSVKNEMLIKIVQKYHQSNPELQEKTLMLLQQQISEKATADTILKTVKRFYADASLADEAIDFLIEVGALKKQKNKTLIEAKEKFNATYGREIKAGRNIADQVRNFSAKAGLGNPTALRNLYRDITGNPRTPHQLYEELTQKFKFSDMKNIIDFILHSLGSDMKAKGPSISHAELQRLFGEARTMQAILGVFRFFFSRMKLIQGQFKRFELVLSSKINFEMLGRLLMKLLEERYPSPDKVIKLSFVLGISKELAAQIIIFTQYRDALRHISPKLFKSERHRQDLSMTLIEALSDLEDEMEEEEEEEEEESPPPPLQRPKDTME